MSRLNHALITVQRPALHLLTWHVTAATRADITKLRTMTLWDGPLGGRSETATYQTGTPPETAAAHRTLTPPDDSEGAAGAQRTNQLRASPGRRNIVTVRTLGTSAKVYDPLSLSAECRERGDGRAAPAQMCRRRRPTAPREWPPPPSLRPPLPGPAPSCPAPPGPY